MHDLRRLLDYLKPHWVKFTFATLAMLAVGLLQSAIGALIVPIFDQAFQQNGSVDPQRTPTLFGLQHIIPDGGLAAWRTISVLLVVFAICKGVAEYLSTYLMARVGQEAVLSLRQNLFTHLLTQSADFFERHRTNYLVSRLVSSSGAIETAVTSTLRDMLRESFKLAAFLAASFYYSWRLTLGALLIAPLIAALTAKFGRALRNLSRESYEGNQRLVDTAQEALANHTIVKAYRAERREQERFTAVVRQIMHANLRSARISGFAPPTIELIGVFAVVLLLFFGQREIAAGHMNGSQFLTFLFFLFSSYDPMRKLSRLHNSMEQALAAARHVWEVMDEHAETKEAAHPFELRPLHDQIELRDVSFGYGGEAANSPGNNPGNNRPVLQKIDLQIPAGSTVALVGESGGGKSTLTKLILRFHDPVSGAVLWDGTDLRDARLSSLRRHIAVVTQETVLFNESVRYNISYSRPDATNAEIEQAARVAFAHDFIMELPAGYSTLVGERGVFLSGGQRQRLAIARAVLANASVLVLDEATSALDVESERLVQRALANLMQNRTTVVIAHRLSTIRRADQIVVIERGRIMEMGSHDALLAQSGSYRRLYELQFADQEELTAVGSEQ
ncbi:MAG: ABC transporter ATP-binding protein [Pyrinomonadaceae bacterium]|nr:ABC transporter ATP-binding protein [Pyrinomonadaceae bacterium]